ncbi:ATP-binding protein, partial [Brucella endophytica]
MMEILTDRIRRYLFARIRRLAILDLYERAAVAGLLEADFIVPGDEQSGTVWHVPEQSLHLLNIAPSEARAEIMRQLGKAARAKTTTEMSMADIAEKLRHENVRSAPKRRGAPDVTKTSARSARDFLALLREHLPAPVVVHVAMALLVARAVGPDVPDLTALSDGVRGPGTFILLKVPVPGFERRFGLMLEDGLILPYWVKLENVHRSSPFWDGRADRRLGKTRKTIRTLGGTDVAKADERQLSRALTDVLLERTAPVIVADETRDPLAPFVSMTPDLALECGGLDYGLVAELLHVCCGIAPEQSLLRMEAMALDPDGLSIDALALAVRPGRDLEHILSILKALGEWARSEGKSEDDDDSRGSGRDKDRSNRAKTKNRSAEGIDIIQPAKPAETSIAASPRVETLSGYGAARDWALDLKADLQLWRGGEVAWNEMSTRLLLSGPPGTGKTTYARALCNTLQVPLLATSVASWLEPSYLGDVLKRMAKSFELARENAPVILFIDEIDNIGSRSAARREQHDDYWRSLINRLLELLDGASKTEGVIVVAATNLPEKIDPALLRSGRLEKHVAIPLPDIEALTGILAHHLGSDLADVLASAPTNIANPSEAAQSPAQIARACRHLRVMNAATSWTAPKNVL